MHFPGFLKKGDTISIVGVASKVDQKIIEGAIDIIESWGLEVIRGQHLFVDHYRFSGNEKQRTQDFQTALDDPGLKAIFVARGGYGSSKIVDAIDWRAYLKSPKWIIGFSDITTILMHLQNLGVAGIHGLMPAQFVNTKYKDSVEQLKSLLFGQKTTLTGPATEYNQHGRSTATLVGGNLSIICSLIGTKSDTRFDNCIFFIEEIEEEMYRIDRMMNQLNRAGKLQGIAGLAIGHFTRVNDDDENPYGEAVEEIIKSYFQDRHIPIAFGLPIGHEAPNLPVIVGKDYTLDVGENGSFLF